MCEHRTLTLPECMQLCCALDKLCAVSCIYLAIISVAGHMSSVTVILFVHSFELCEIVESTWNGNLVNVL